MANFRESSKANWNNGFDKPSTEQLTFGALQRIADAAEKVADNLITLMHERDKYKRWYEEQQKENKTLSKKLNAYKGIIKRLKARIN